MTKIVLKQNGREMEATKEDIKRLTVNKIKFAVGKAAEEILASKKEEAKEDKKVLSNMEKLAAKELKATKRKEEDRLKDGPVEITKGKIVKPTKK